MKLSEIEKRYKKNYIGDEPMHLNIEIEIEVDPNTGNFIIRIKERESNPLCINAFTTQDIAEAVRKYIEEEI